MTIRQALAALMACLGAAGCSPLVPRPDVSRYLVLNSVALTGVGGRSSPLAIGVGPVNFPGYLRHPEVVTRVNANQLAISAKDRWAEPLDRDFKRVLAENLMRLLDTQQILQYPWYPGTQIDYQIVVSVRNFEAISGGQSQLRASWLIKDGKDGHELHASETIANTPLGSGNAGVSAALSNDLATLSRAFAAQVTQLSHERAASPQVMADRD
jgi:uncharacterized lipoprotein YmbA